MSEMRIILESIDGNELGNFRLSKEGAPPVVTWGARFFRYSHQYPGRVVFRQVEGKAIEQVAS